MARRRAHPTGSAELAVLGGETLLGREVRDALESAALGAQVRLFSLEGDQAAFITEQGGEATLMTPFRPQELAAVKAVFLTGTPEASARAYEVMSAASIEKPVVDLSGALEDRADARLRAPTVEPEGAAPGAAAIQVIAHPAAIALALFLKQARKAGAIRRAVVQIFEPASERGRGGIEELQQQTVGLLSFKKLNTDVFDAQAAFNLLPRYGSGSPHSLEGVELKIERHLASLLTGEPGVPMPSLHLAHAPVFHGYSFSAWVEFEERPAAKDLERTLAADNIDVRAGEHEPPSNVGVAGQSGIIVGGLAPDRNDARANWFWIVADNFKLASENAVEVARGLLA